MTTPASAADLPRRGKRRIAMAVPFSTGLRRDLRRGRKIGPGSEENTKATRPGGPGR